MTVAALVISLIALAVSGGALIYTRRQALANERSVALAEAEAAKYRAPWMLTWIRGDTFALVNDGDEPCYAVEVEFPANSLVSRAVQADHVSAGSAETFMFAATEATRGRDVVVQWKRAPSGDVLVWKYPLPDRGVVA